MAPSELGLRPNKPFLLVFYYLCSRDMCPLCWNFVSFFFILSRISPSYSSRQYLVSCPLFAHFTLLTYCSRVCHAKLKLWFSVCIQVVVSSWLLKLVKNEYVRNILRNREGQKLLTPSVWTPRPKKRKAEQTFFQFQLDFQEWHSNHWLGQLLMFPLVSLGKGRAFLGTKSRDLLNSLYKFHFNQRPFCLWSLVCARVLSPIGLLRCH